MDKVHSAIIRLAKKALTESLPSDMTERVARDVFGSYDLHRRSGVPENIPITGQAAAVAVVDDSVREGRILPLVERLALLDRDGFMGRAYRVPGLRELFKALQAEGYLWDAGSCHFMENPAIRRTANWGRLLDGEEYAFALLRVDVVNNSLIVRRRGEAAAREAYAELRERFRRAAEKRFGRLWKWEGDGGVAAFHYGNAPTSAALAGLAFLNDLFVYNRTSNALGERISVRVAGHAGPLRYSSVHSEMAKQETSREAGELEARRTPPDSFCLSPALSRNLERVVLDRFREEFRDGMLVHVFSVEGAAGCA